MKIKHSKYRNTGLIYELLVKQIAADTLSAANSPAIKILKEHFGKQSALSRELKLYRLITQATGVSQAKAEAILSTITEVSRKLDRALLKKQKYKLIANIKESYNIDEFFAIQVRDYKPLAALYCLLEVHTNDVLVDPNFLVDNKTTILEHLTTKKQNKKNVQETLIEEFSKYDKDLKLLTFKILLEKFNDNYKDLLPAQKRVLKEFITSVNSTTRLRNIVNEEIKNIIKEVNALKKKVTDKAVAIKLTEVLKTVKQVSNKEKVGDSHLVNLMLYYELLEELKKV